MAPQSVVVIKLSALGDVLNTLPVVRTLQQELPATRIQWVIGKAAMNLLGAIKDIEFVVIDKNQGARGRAQIQQLINATGPIDVLLHMQYAWRASMLVRGIKAHTKIGYDRERALDLQWLFTNQRIAAQKAQHVLDAHFEFAKAIGVTQKHLRWDIPMSSQALAKAQRLIPENSPTILISPCASNPLRNWRPERYAAVADQLVKCGYQIMLTGGQSAAEQQMGQMIESHMQQAVVNWIGKDTLPEMAATLSRAKAIITPDSGPAHLGNALSVPVLGLYACTNPKRSGPYQYLDCCVDRFNDAAMQFTGKPAEALNWRTKIEQPGAMDLISIDDVLERFDHIENTFKPGARLASDYIVKSYTNV